MKRMHPKLTRAQVAALDAQFMERLPSVLGAVGAALIVERTGCIETRVRPAPPEAVSSAVLTRLDEKKQQLRALARLRFQTLRFSLPPGPEPQNEAPNE